MVEIIKNFESELRKFLASEDYGRGVIERHREGAMLRMRTFQERRLHEISAHKMLSGLPKSITRPKSPSPRRGRIATERISVAEIRGPGTEQRASHSNLSLLVAAMGYLPASVTGVMNTLSSLAILETVSASEKMPIRGINATSTNTRLSGKILKEREAREHLQQKQRQRKEFDLRTRDRVRHRIQQQKLLEQQEMLVKKHQKEARSRSRKRQTNANSNKQPDSEPAAPSKTTPLTYLLNELHNEPGRSPSQYYALELLDTASVEERAAKILDAPSSASNQPASPSPRSYVSQLEHHQQALRKARASLLKTDSYKMDSWLSATLPVKKQSKNNKGSDGPKSKKRTATARTEKTVAAKPPFQLLLEEHHRNPLPGCMRQKESALDLLSFVSREEQLSKTQHDVNDPAPVAVQQLPRPSTTGGIYSGSAVRTVTNRRRNGAKCNPLSGCNRNDCIVKRRLEGQWIKEDSLFTVKELPIRRHCGCPYSPQHRRVLEQASRQRGPRPPSTGEEIVSLVRSKHPRGTSAAAPPYKTSHKSPNTSYTNHNHDDSLKSQLNISLASRTTPESVKLVRSEIRRLQEILRVKELALAADEDLIQHTSSKVVPPP
eukprot:TRINITY_DN3026_c2_g1_i1.p1 TRINITY_DN3026_c2_g1~~TRINITY_DN3026_c2_g1_i1.p1  ORF type:complete len:665 (+),score=112.44 TRINITY_DN3026_c2_g1_i1:183-1997(+)